MPTITYAAEVKQLTANDMRVLNTAVNDAIRRIFSFSRWESERMLRMSHSYDSIYEIFEKRRLAFSHGLSCHPNKTLRHIYLYLVKSSNVE